MCVSVCVCVHVCVCVCMCMCVQHSCNVSINLANEERQQNAYYCIMDVYAQSTCHLKQNHQYILKNSTLVTYKVPLWQAILSGTLPT